VRSVQPGPHNLLSLFGIEMPHGGSLFPYSIRNAGSFGCDGEQPIHRLEKIKTAPALLRSIQGYTGIIVLSEGRMVEGRAKRGRQAISP